MLVFTLNVSIYLRTFEGNAFFLLNVTIFLRKESSLAEMAVWELFNFLPRTDIYQNICLAKFNNFMYRGM